MDQTTKNALSEIFKKIDEIKGRTQGEYNPTDLHEIECELRRLADRAQVIGSPFLKH